MHQTTELMKIPSAHLTYCTNIHPGESWLNHFEALKDNVPDIRSKVAPGQPFGIGLRLSHLASLELGEEEHLETFKRWLKEHNCYVFTMNGFPYGGFHHTRVKDLVHQPDWTTQDRVVYTLQLFQLLSKLLPKGLQGGISTSPLSYRHWHTDKADQKTVFITATENVIKVVEELLALKQSTGHHLHLDIEPEPDGLIETGAGFIDWYQEYLLPMGVEYFTTKKGMSEQDAAEVIHDHIQLCYDICHFAVGYEDHAKVIAQLRKKKIRIGKVQVSAALKAPLAIVPDERGDVERAFRSFNESTYLHQVVALQQGNALERYPDLPDALRDIHNPASREWRAHFHVPVFVKDFGLLKSTQEDIEAVLALHRQHALTKHFEVETYTWEVLPAVLKRPLKESIVRELEWVGKVLSDNH
jgi:hypothetical protein